MMYAQEGLSLFGTLRAVDNVQLTAMEGGLFAQAQLQSTAGDVVLYGGSSVNLQDSVKAGRGNIIIFGENIVTQDVVSGIAVRLEAREQVAVNKVVEAGALYSTGDAARADGLLEITSYLDEIYLMDDARATGVMDIEAHEALISRGDLSTSGDIFLDATHGYVSLSGAVTGGEDIDIQAYTDLSSQENVTATGGLLFQSDTGQIYVFGDAHAADSLTLTAFEGDIANGSLANPDAKLSSDTSVEILTGN